MVLTTKMDVNEYLKISFPVLFVIYLVNCNSYSIRFSFGVVPYFTSTSATSFHFSNSYLMYKGIKHHAIKKEEGEENLSFLKNPHYTSNSFNGNP